MSLVLSDLPRDPDRLLQHLQQMNEVVTRQNASLVSLQAKYDTVLTEQDTLRAERDAAQAEIEKLRLLIRQLQRRQFGRRSEKLDPDQLQLGLEDLEQTVAAAEAAQEEVAARNSTPRTPRVRQRNLGALPAHLPRVEVLVDVEDKTCPCCGGALHAIGEDTSEMLDIVPAQLRVKVIRRPRYGCRACEEAVVQAPGTGMADHQRDGDRSPAGACAGGQVRRFPAALSPSSDLRPAGYRARPLHLVRLGWAGLLVAGAALAPAAPARHELDPDLRR
jgi:hypothetical protein